MLGLVLLAAVAIDVRWLKNRGKLLSRVYVSPTYLALRPAQARPKAPLRPTRSTTSWRDVELIGLGEIEGPEDPILDSQGNLYSGTRHGDIVRFSGPDLTELEVFVHIGGHPLGMAFDQDENLISLRRRHGRLQDHAGPASDKLTDETNRSWFSVIDDSRMRLADDLDIAPDGRIFFSEATIRFDMSEWMVDALEARGNGRIICYDPRNSSTRTVIPTLQFPNGICVASDGQSFFYRETWGCNVSALLVRRAEGGQREVVIANLPGYPDNINRASDGGYWLALVGMRTPVFDLALAQCRACAQADGPARRA